MDGVAKARCLDNGRNARRRFLPAEPHQHAVHDDVPRAREFQVESCPKRQQRRGHAFGIAAPGVGAEHPRHHPQQCGLAGAVGADDAELLATAKAQGDIRKR